MNIEQIIREYKAIVIALGLTLFFGWCVFYDRICKEESCYEIISVQKTGKFGKCVIKWKNSGLTETKKTYYPVKGKIYCKCIRYDFW